jgi:hypothetical protein
MEQNRTFSIFDWSKRLTAYKAGRVICFRPLPYRTRVHARKRRVLANQNARIQRILANFRETTLKCYTYRQGDTPELKFLHELTKECASARQCAFFNVAKVRPRREKEVLPHNKAA